jgi:hypothetical protein
MGHPSCGSKERFMDTHRVARRLAFALALVAGLAPSVLAEDLAVYRGFRLGMSVEAVVGLAQADAADVKLVVERPMLIQELRWRPPTPPGVDGVLPESDSVAQVTFSFCNGALYRTVVNYDPSRTEGLTDQDLIDALSAVYGPARMPVPAGRVTTSPVSQSFVDSELLTARWEDSETSVNLYRGSYRSNFGLVMYSKKLSPLVRAAVETGLRLARLDAPQREAAAKKLQDEAEKAMHDKSRGANKAAFRY